MKKIPTVFVRDWGGNPKHVTREINPECEWVFTDPDAKPTRKYDGTCVELDQSGRWWARREVKPGKTPPLRYVNVEHDPNTGKNVGWEPIEQSGFAKFHAEALAARDFWKSGTYELVGPKINGNPEELDDHYLIPHADATVVDFEMTDYDVVREVVLGLRARFGAEGIVWHHPDGRMAKIKARDFPVTGEHEPNWWAKMRRSLANLPEPQPVVPREEVVAAGEPLTIEERAPEYVHFTREQLDEAERIRRYRAMPDPHQHYPRNYSPAGMRDEIAAWHEEHQRWLKEQGVATTAEARQLLAQLEEVVSRLDDADAKSVMNDVSTFETDWWGNR